MFQVSTLIDIQYCASERISDLSDFRSLKTEEKRKKKQIRELGPQENQ